MLSVCSSGEAAAINIQEVIGGLFKHYVFMLMIHSVPSWLLPARRYCPLDLDPVVMAELTPGCKCKYKHVCMHISAVLID